MWPCTVKKYPSAFRPFESRSLAIWVAKVWGGFHVTNLQAKSLGL
jgi:hypothetical protein